MRPAASVRIALLLNIVLTNVGFSQGTGGNSGQSLSGGPPMSYIVLPPLPSTGFHAWCETPRGFCKVQSDAPIAPGSTCHCAEYPGRTA